MGPKSRWGGVWWGGVGIGYVRPVQFLDHLTVITNLQLSYFVLIHIQSLLWSQLSAAENVVAILCCRAVLTKVLIIKPARKARGPEGPAR